MEDIMMLEGLFEGFTLNTNWLTLMLLLGMAMDFATGIAKGYKREGRVGSAKLRCGGFKKAGIMLVVLLSYGLSVLFTDEKRLIFNSVQCYYIYMEIISILENLTELDVKLPNILKSILGKNNT